MACIVPSSRVTELSPNDPIFRLDEISEPIGPLTNAEIDAAVYGA